VTPLDQQTAVITGASSGVGRAVALALIAAGTTVCGVGRRLEALQGVDTRIQPFVADLADDTRLESLCRSLVEHCERVDILVHCAGIILGGTTESSSLEDFDRQYRVNVRAPYRLTQALLPHLKRCGGQVVFINSSVVGQAKPGAGQYTATKAALKAMADCVRAEVNRDGVRVLSMFLGRTATPMQAEIHRSAGRTYEPSSLLQPEDVARSVVGALELPRTAEVTDMHLRPMTRPD
jgi:NADP-dependent 3-hydroxy acid dehydrogenase YdfG